MDPTCSDHGVTVNTFPLICQGSKDVCIGPHACEVERGWQVSIRASMDSKHIVLLLPR